MRLANQATQVLVTGADDAGIYRNLFGGTDRADQLLLNGAE